MSILNDMTASQDSDGDYGGSKRHSLLTKEGRLATNTGGVFAQTFVRKESLPRGNRMGNATTTLGTDTSTRNMNVFKMNTTNLL